MIPVNYVAIVVCAVIGMIIGALWHSKILFGKIFMEASGMDMNMTPEKMKEMQKEMWKLYLTQFVLLLIELYVLSHIIVMGMAYFGTTGAMSGISTAFWVWLGFAMPLAASNAMWSNRPRKMAWRLFFINAGYMLVSLLIFGVILGVWM